MTAWSLELWCWVSSFLMHRQAFTAAAFGCCLFGRLGYLPGECCSLAGCFQGVSLGNDSAIIHHCWLPLMSRSFGIAEFISASFVSQDVPKCRFCHSQYCRICQLHSLRMACFTCTESSFDLMLSLHSKIFQMQATHLKSTPDLLFVWLIMTPRRNCPHLLIK